VTIELHGSKLTGLDAEDYRLQARPGSSRLDLVATWYTNALTYANATPVAVNNGQSLVRDLKLQRGASISGTVLNNRDNPVEGIGVDVFDLDGQKALTAWTDAQGKYTSTGLLPGSYKVRFMPGYYGGDGLVQQWWNGKRTEATATIIEISAKQQSTGVDAKLAAIGNGDTAPSAPLDVTATPGDGTVTLRWKAPVDNGGLAITSYKVKGLPSGECETLGNVVCTIEGLNNGTNYTFTVKAQNSVGLSPASVASAPVVPFGKPAAPTAMRATAGVEKATVSWTPGADNGRPITGYTATSTPGGKTCSSAGTTCDVVGLTGGTSYTFTVRATNAAGASKESAASNAVTHTASTPGGTQPPLPPPPPPAPAPTTPPPTAAPTTPPPAAPSAPAKVKAKVKKRKLTVTWPAVSGATKYQVRVNKGSKKGRWKTVTKPKFATGKLKKGRYTIEVKAIGAGGTGPVKKSTVKVK
jgi:hypothetical protein